MIKDVMRSELELIEEEKKFWKLIASQNQFSFEIEEALKIKNFSSPLKEQNKVEGVSPEEKLKQTNETKKESSGQEKKQKKQKQ